MPHNNGGPDGAAVRPFPLQAKEGRFRGLPRSRLSSRNIFMMIGHFCSAIAAIVIGALLVRIGVHGLPACQAFVAAHAVNASDERLPKRSPTPPCHLVMAGHFPYHHGLCYRGNGLNSAW